MDDEQVSERVEKLLDLMGADLTHRIVTEWLNKASARVQKQFGDTLLTMIPEACRTAVREQLEYHVRRMTEKLLSQLTPRIEATVLQVLEPEIPQMTQNIVERLRKWSPDVADAAIKRRLEQAFKH